MASSLTFPGNLRSSNSTQLVERQRGPQIAITEKSRRICERLVDCTARIEAEDRRIESKHRYLALLSPDCAVCQDVQHSLGACYGNEVLPEALESADRFI